MALVIAVDDPRAPDVRALLTAHLAFARSLSPPEHVHALEVEGLLEPAVTFFSARGDGRLMGVGALKHLDDGHGELKSMHVAEGARGQGVGRALVAHLVSEARRRGYGRVSIETGTMDGFAPARALYVGAGFVSCEPFGAYTVDAYSVCMTLPLDGDPANPVARET
jgi:putative acetyltransferase